MKAILLYLVQMIAVSGLLYAYYHFALRNNKFHQYNRFYLLAATVISIVVPFLNIPFYFTAEEKESSFLLQTITVISPATPASGDIPVYTPTQQSSGLSLSSILWYSYLLVITLLLLRFLFSLLQIRRIIRKYPAEKLGKIRFLNTTEPGTPYSFFKWLFWNRNIELNSSKGEQVFRHELFHITQKHSYDIMYMELLTTLAWFNPFFYLIKKELKAIHEFLADQFAVEETKKWEYAELLLMYALQTKQSLVNPFFHNQIKRRIAMITKPQTPGQQYARKLLVLPLAAIILFLFAFSYKEISRPAATLDYSSPTEEANKSDTTIKPVVHKITWNENFALPLTQPTQQQLADWANPQQFGIWIDNKRTNNKELLKYKPDDFSYVNVSKLAKNAVNYGKYYYQVTLMTNAYYEKETQKPTTSLTKNISLSNGTTKVLGSRFNNSLIVLNGKIREDLTAETLEKTVPVETIQTITVLRGSDAMDKYGKQGGNGVVEIVAKISSATEKARVADEGLTAGKINSRNILAPSFVGGDNAWKNFLQKNLDASIPVKNNAPAGNYSVIIQFTVDKNGAISDIIPLTQYGYGMEKEAMRVIQLSPIWNPANQNGQIVKAIHKQPVTFVVKKKDGTTSSPPAAENDNIVFQKVEIEPYFPGGEIKFREYVQSYQKNHVKEVGAPAGPHSVMVEFIVKTDGRISDVKLAAGTPSSAYATAAIELIKSSPNWNPAVQNGRPVNAYKRQAVIFVSPNTQLPSTSQWVEAAGETVPKISTEELRQATVHQLLGLPADVVIVSYSFAIDTDDGQILEIPNKGSYFSSSTKDVIMRAKAGKTITFDRILTLENGMNKRNVSRVYRVVN